MMRADYLKPKIWLPILCGLSIVGIFVAIGENDDAPMFTLLGLISAILLLFYGIYNVAAESKRSLPVGILFFMLSAIGIALTIILWFKGEYSDSPGVCGLIVMISLGFGMVGAKFVRKRQ